MFTKEELLKMNLHTIQSQGYIYDLAKGGSTKFNASNKKAPMPSRGSRLNCQAAADMLMDMCKADEEENGVRFNLKKVYYSNPKGFIVLAAPGRKAFGTNEPPIGSGANKCWEFDNHYRVLDVETGKYYDPTFGTMDADNPEGIVGTSDGSTKEGGITTMWGIYGNKYKVERSIGNMAPPDKVTELTSAPAVSDSNKVRNSHFS